MNDTEKIREFIERVKGEHIGQQVGAVTWCTSIECRAFHPCDALRAVLALEELARAVELLTMTSATGQLCIRTANGIPMGMQRSQERKVRQALARAAQKVSG